MDGVDVGGDEVDFQAGDLRLGDRGPGRLDGRGGDVRERDLERERVAADQLLERAWRGSCAGAGWVGGVDAEVGRLRLVLVALHEGGERAAREAVAAALEVRHDGHRPIKAVAREAGGGGRRADVEDDEVVVVGEVNLPPDAHGDDELLARDAAAVPPPGRGRGRAFRAARRQQEQCRTQDGGQEILLIPLIIARPWEGVNGPRQSAGGSRKWVPRLMRGSGAAV